MEVEELNINIMGEEDGSSQEKHWDKWVSPECSQILPPLAASVAKTPSANPFLAAEDILFNFLSSHISDASYKRYIHLGGWGGVLARVTSQPRHLNIKVPRL